MPKAGTATKTHSASAAVVDSDAVGGSKPGITVHRLAAATKRNSVPMKPRYFSGCFRPTSSIFLAIAVTTISSRHCQRDNVRPVASLRVSRAEPRVSTSISAQVKTIVALSLMNPCCQNTHWSGLRRMAGLGQGRLALWRRRPCQPGHRRAGRDEAEQAEKQPLPVAAGHDVEPAQGHAHAQQRTDDDALCGPRGRSGASHGPPQAAEEDR